MTAQRQDGLEWLEATETTVHDSKTDALQRGVSSVMLRSYKGSFFRMLRDSIRHRAWPARRMERSKGRGCGCTWHSLAGETRRDRVSFNLQALAFSDVLADLMDWLPEPFPSRTVVQVVRRLEVMWS